MVKEMELLREMLDDNNIPWIDCSSNNPSIPGFNFCLDIDRTHFDYKGVSWSAINGYGTYGGYNIMSGKNEGLIELYNGNEDPTGWLTAKECMDKVLNTFTLKL